jgi:hypothetical protein
MGHPQRLIISRIPHSGMTAEQWGIAVDNELIEFWMRDMSASERKTLVFDDMGRLILDNVSSELFAKLDSIILEQAQSMGWRIGLSELVRFRFSCWDLEHDGPDKHKKYGVACRRSARIFQHLERPPLDPDQWLVKKETVEELRLVLKTLRASFALRRDIRNPDVHEFFYSAIAASPQSFPHLFADLKRWQMFCEKKPLALAPLVTSDRPQPATLYDEFLSTCSGWEQETLRQAITRLGHAKL